MPSINHKCKSSKKSKSFKRSKNSKNSKNSKSNKKTRLNMRKKKGGGEQNKIVENYNEAITALYENEPLPSIILPNNLCENKKKGFYKLSETNIPNETAEDIGSLFNEKNIPKQLLYCIGPDNKIVGTQYDDILPGQDSISQEIVDYKQIQLLNEYKQKGYIDIKFKNCCKIGSKQRPFLPDKHHRFVSAIQLKLPIKLINKENEKPCDLINSQMGSCEIGNLKDGNKSSISNVEARENWEKFKSLTKNEPWVKQAILSKCGKITDTDEKQNCIKTGKLFQFTECKNLIGEENCKLQTKIN